MGYFFHKVQRDQIKPGDHIYTWRPAFTYSHHGIYVGENMVVHFTAQENAISGSGWNLSSGFPSSCSNYSIDSGISQRECEQNSDSGPRISGYECGFHQPDSGVMISCLNCFIGTGSLYLFQYGVKVYVCISKLRGGTCTTAQSGPPDDVIHRAMFLLKEGFGKYNVLNNNCEDFALYCKTRLLVCWKQKQPTTGSSGQVNFIVNAPWKVVLGPALPEVVGAITVGVTVGKYYWDRYKSDLGVRDDVVEVPVGNVRLFRGW